MDCQNNSNFQVTGTDFLGINTVLIFFFFYFKLIVNFLKIIIHIVSTIMNKEIILVKQLVISFEYLLVSVLLSQIPAR